MEVLIIIDTFNHLKSKKYLKAFHTTLMDDTTQEQPTRQLPFNNLYLISGLVHGWNKVWMYFFTFTLLLFGYCGFQLAMFYPLQEILLRNGYSEFDIIKNVG